MKKMQKIISYWLICCLLLAILPTQVLAVAEIAAESAAETAAEPAAEPSKETVGEVVTEPAEETVAETEPEPASEPLELPVEETVPAQEPVFEEAASTVAATTNETWIQQQIDSGLTEIYIDDAIVLENDFVISSRVQLFIRDGSITIPAGKTLTNTAAQINVWEEGSFTVAYGGRFDNRSEFRVAGTLAVYGTFEGVVHTYYWTDRANATIIGVPNSAIWMHYVVGEGSSTANQAKFLENWALMESSNYGYYSQQIHGDMTLPGDLIIPDNCWMTLEVERFTFTIPEGVKVTNYGHFDVYQNQTVENYGTFENAGSMNIQGRWTGNQPVASGESWIQDQINAGKKEIALEKDIVLSKNFILPQDIFVRFNGHTITVPGGRTLTVRGQLGTWWEQGGLIVESGGALINEGYIGSSGILNIQGSFSGNYIHTTSVLGGMHADISGLADEDIWMHYVVDNGNPQTEHQDLFLEYWDLMNSTDYGYYSMQLHGNLTLPCDLVIPANCYFVLESQTFTMTIPAGRKVTNYGDFVSYASQTVINYGTFENAGYMSVQGSWLGNQPVKAKMTQDQLEGALAQTDYYYLQAEVTLERDMTLTKHLYIRPGAKLVVPAGVKLTVENNITVVAGGTLNILGEYELIPTENGHRSIGRCLENGVYSTVTGVRAEDMSLNCIVYDSYQLLTAINLANTTNYGWYFAYVYRDAAITSNVQINTFIEVSDGATITVSPYATVTNNNQMAFWGGTTLINQGTINNRGEMIFHDGATLNNTGKIQVDGVLANYGGVVNSGTINCGSDGHLEDEGVWEGNQPIIPHRHDYTAVVTQPTCTEEGYTTHTCDCGDTYTDSRVDALGHTEVIDKGKVPTCVDAGISDGRHCSVCGEVLETQSTLEPTGIHNYTDGKCELCGQEKFPLIDVDGNGVIGENDAVQLLWHALFPTEQTVPGWGDVTGDGKATVEDAVYVVWHTLFPGMYPI